MPTKEPYEGQGRVSRGRDFSVLIAVEPPSLERLIEHVLYGHPGLRVVGGGSKRVSPAHLAARLIPDVIIVNSRANGLERSGVAAELKRSSPASTLIHLTHVLGEPVPDQGTDACLPEEAVVRRLLPVIHQVARVRERTQQSAPAVPRTPSRN